MQNAPDTDSRHDPGDAVPEGVAVEQPVPLTEKEQAVKRKLEELPETADPSRKPD
ncbi:hypothetical protein [Teichococcus vastitatis]|jgi:hypothetical protein|uniref:Uncharacterized protein n=1 Tax=Teichococcus vastitatis TaxID=2307076 RepID=A0ABS9W366_9PROT|nr:hypothetical protein [Pseudoroseomonas vastitatis]MCI0753643.1 hypothetical protein [Pseudoroseomonas vastitatis]